MKLISLILSVAVCCDAVAQGQDNYSLWPRRPAELEQAQRLIRERQGDEALALLSPFVHKRGLAGHESRHLVGSIRTPRYLSAQHPRIRRHTVRRGENIEKIANAYGSSSDLLIFINGMINPSNLRAGQHLYVVPQDLRAELNVEDREITVWDGKQLVACYDVTPEQQLTKGENEETQLREREGELNGARIPRSSSIFVSSNRILRLANGIILMNPGQSASGGPHVRMNAKELNELSLLLRNGSRFSIVRKPDLFDPFVTQSPPPTATPVRKGTTSRRSGRR